MTSKPPTPGRAFITPLQRPDLFQAGQVFPQEELLRRVLSVFWRNCCGVPGLARAPAPVVELSVDPSRVDGAGVRTRAWWVLYDGIIEETDGPASDRIALFFGREGQTGQLWPRYEFQLAQEPFTVEMSFHQEPGLVWVIRIHLESRADGTVYVSGEEMK